MLLPALALTLIEGAALVYPSTPRGEVVEQLHGVQVPDPYRWLETDVRESKEVAAWIEEENRVTFQYLESIPQRASIRERLKSIWDYERYSVPVRFGGRLYFEYNNGLQNQSVLYVQAALDSAPEVLLDPNTWSADGTAALSDYVFSPQGRYLAYGVSEAGSDWKTWRVMDLATRQTLPDEVKWSKHASVAWTADEAGFFYGRFPEPDAAYQSVSLNHQLFHHRVGAAQTDDVLVFARPDQPAWNFEPLVSEDGRYLIISIWEQSNNAQVYYRDLAEPYALARPLVDHFENEYYFLGNDGPVFFFVTDREAPRKRVVAIDSRRPAPEDWREIIPEQKDSIENAALINNLLVITFLEDAKSRVALFDLAGKLVRDLELPGLGTVDGFLAKRSDSEAFYSFSSFATPPTLYRYDLNTGESAVWKQAKVDFDAQAYQVEQVFYQSKDGTRVPMFIVRRKNATPNGNLPVLLYGYGGFGVSLTPMFSPARAAWLELGGVYAVPNLRGGGEYGRAWHDAGKARHKQNVFDDFIAAAEWLIANHYTTSARLAIQGGSNGGLLVGAVMTQRPELFGAALPAVGVMDMLRFHKFTAGRYWTDDFGSAEDPEQFKAILAYSPYHNLKEGVCYPPTLVTTADTDDRVVPGHSFKFAAALQHAQACDNPVLLRVETRAGHGAGKPTGKRIEEAADQLAFLVKVLGM